MRRATSTRRLEQARGMKNAKLLRWMKKWGCSLSWPCSRLRRGVSPVHHQSGDGLWRGEPEPLRPGLLVDHDHSGRGLGPHGLHPHPIQGEAGAGQAQADPWSHGAGDRLDHRPGHHRGGHRHPHHQGCVSRSSGLPRATLWWWRLRASGTGGASTIPSWASPPPTSFTFPWAGP